MTRAALFTIALLLPASPALAKSGEGGLLYPILNFVLLLGVLFYFARAPIRKFFHDRRAEIQRDLQRAADLKREAEERYSLWQRKLMDLEDELAKIRETSRGRAESERDHILAEATASAERIRSDATAAIEQELRRSREILRGEAADLAVELAENLLRDHVSDTDRNRLVSEFIDRIDSYSDAGTTGASN